MLYRMIHQNESFIVIDKLPGVNFHKEGEDDSLFEALRRDLAVEGLYPVHRLDKMTSGVLIIALSSEVAAELTTQFEKRLVQKTYIALSDKKPKKKQGTISGDMERSRRKSWKLLRTRNNPAITLFKSASCEAKKRLYIVTPKTGKTHQIRVALKSIGAAILGDPIYSPDADQYDRGYLHAYAVTFMLQNKNYTFHTEPSEGVEWEGYDFKKLLSDS
ncbi:MAG: TIGR01621 family pseudouridine synthase [Fibrobacterales bacterium]